MGFCLNRECAREAPLPEDTEVCPDCGFDNTNWEQLHALITCEDCEQDNPSSRVECWKCGTSLLPRRDQDGMVIVCADCGRPRHPLAEECSSCGCKRLFTNLIRTPSSSADLTIYSTGNSSKEPSLSQCPIKEWRNSSNQGQC